jgi:O-methyltransferase/methyltransferase family protein
MAKKKKGAKGKPLPAVMLDLIIGYWVSQLVHVAAKLGLADLLKGGPKSPAELARSVGADPGTLRRVLRALAGVGVFAERKDGRFALTPLGATLRSDRPDSMRAFAIMMVDDYWFQAWSDLLQSIKTGQTAFDRVHGLKVFDYFGKHPDKARAFGEAMTSISGTENPVVAAACDSSRVGTLVDVGGSHGHLLAAILKANPKLKGVLFDRPQVLEQARDAPYVGGREIAGRMELAPGDFFQSVPAGADAYIMKYILHDWDDDLCVKILENCRRAMAPNGRVLVVDTVIPPGNDPHWGKLLDINMLVGPGGRERTRSEFVQLFARAGLKLKRIIPTASPLSIVEGVSA